ncbi:MAG TPA: O-antigen ligase family protein [Geminicoccus sp.]|uniref:O-antigen ligase family protein n=1 Tax=Geminicoccus sp. TaxID=2024832 RepID=UPI002E33771F|nr:O-antigen ligase family protein [Geminicoccus sp.]HEX2525550.1 O-antigen ligase family protein [Geminicoccus sp.]
MPLVGRLDRVAGFLVMLLPLLFLLGRAVADVALILVAVAFLARSAASRDVAWIWEPWVLVGLAWVGWLTFGGLFAADVASATGKAAVQIRFVLFAAALATVHFRNTAVRANFLLALSSAVVLVAIDCVIQAATGTSLTGRGLPELYRLSGPFDSQKAGTYLAKTIFPTLLPLMLIMGDRRRAAWVVLLALAVAGMIIALTGERSALLTFGLGTLVCLLLLPRLRSFLLPVVLLATLGAGVLVLSRPILVERFVGHTEDDLTNFADKRYGMILRSGLALAADQPITGIGVAEFPKRCPSPELAVIGPVDVRCVSHPHNPWMEMLVEGGVVGLALWLAMVGLWLKRFAAAGRPVLVVGLATLLPFSWPLMTSMSLFTTWNAILWWQAVGLLLALSPRREELRR